MTTPIITYTSLEITDATKRQHNHVLESIRRYCKRNNINSDKFTSTYKDRRNHPRLMYVVPVSVAQAIAPGHFPKVDIKPESVKKKLSTLEMISELALEQDASNKRLEALESDVLTLKDTVENLSIEDVVPQNMKTTSEIVAMWDYYVNPEVVRMVLRKNLPVKTYRIVTEAGIKEAEHWVASQAIRILDKFIEGSAKVGKTSFSINETMLPGRRFRIGA